MNTLHLSDEGTLVYRDDGRGIPLLCLHGWGMSGAMFHRQAEGLGSRYRILAPDLRGHGDSSAFEMGMTFSVLADDLMQLIDSLGLTNLIVVGWSMGAMVAWDLIARHRPSAVVGLVTIDMVPRILNDEQWHFGLREGRDASVFDWSVAEMRRDWSSFAQVFVPRIYSAEHVLEGVDMTLNEAGKNDPESMALCWQAMAEQDFRDTVGNIDVPVLATWGEKSQLYQAAASHWLVNAMPTASGLGFSESGHSPHLEEPQAFNKALANFAAEVVQP